jgi:hypothetical protein
LLLLLSKQPVAYAPLQTAPSRSPKTLTNHHLNLWHKSNSLYLKKDTKSNLNFTTKSKPLFEFVAKIKKGKRAAAAPPAQPHSRRGGCPPPRL